MVLNSEIQVKVGTESGTKSNKEFYSKNIIS